MKLQVEVVLCIVREADRGLVVLVDQTVSVEILVTDISEGRTVRCECVVRTVGEFLLSVEEAVAHESEALSDGMSCGAHPRIWIVCLCLVDDLVSCPAEVAADCIGEVSDGVRPVEHELVTLVLSDTDVCRRYRASYNTVDARNDSEGREDVVSLLIEVVKVSRETVAEELCLDSDVVLA